MTDLSDTFIKALPDLTMVVRRDGLIMSNLGGRELGVPARPGALRGKRLSDLWTAGVAAELAKLIRRALKGRAQADGHFSHENRRIDVRVHPQGVDRVLMVARVRADGAQAQSESSIAELNAMREPPDCAVFAKKFCDAIDRARLRETQVALAIIHFDDLPAIVKSFGAPLGRLLLIAALERVSAIDYSKKLHLGRPLRATQLESDQLAVLIEEVKGHETAARAAEKIRRTLAEAIEVDGRRHQLNPIIGLALFPNDGHEPETLLDRARGAILEAHRSGGQSQVATCSDTAAVESISQPDLERELRWAVEREQFSLEYAPIMELIGRRTVAVAASLNWIHPMCGPVAPMQFVPLLDALDLRSSLDRWILRRGCRDLALLSQRGNTRLSLAIKLTRQAMDTATLIDDVTAAAAGNDISLSRLDIDIDLKTLASGSRVRSQLRELRKRGARVFLENFGADGIVLAQLSSLPLDGVKIAPAFIQNIEQDGGARAVCISAVSIARAFGLKCVAMGVTKRSQLEFLYECSCEQAMGPLFGLPKPVSELSLTSPADSTDVFSDIAATSVG
ncbi:MAG TPA: EAL domain-containing protein [Steroidobacteraceae bacterium]|nr:EAL domain-containing protein [Steroidobacteraceae bacterium]